MKILQDLPSVPLAFACDLPLLPGVYFVTTCDQVLYIGQSTSLRRRFLGHHRFSEFEASMATTVYYLVLPVALLDPIEAALITAIAPSLNVGAPSVRSVEAAPSSVHNPWGQPKTEALYQRMTPTGLELLRQKAKLSGLSLGNFLECAARGIEPSPDAIRAYVEGRKLTSR